MAYKLVVVQKSPAKERLKELKAKQKTQKLTPTEVAEAVEKILEYLDLK